jgi:predicted TIM-barrel fold metal-dependent hydrolase
MIDTHTHLRGTWTPDGIRRDLDTMDLAKAIVAALPLDHWGGGLTEDVAPLLKAVPDRLVGLIGIHPPDVEGSLRRIREFGDQPGFIGIKLMPTVGYYCDEERFRPIFEEVNRRGWIVLSHCGWCSKGVKTPDLPQSTRFTDPYHIEPLARIFPQTDFILAHAGGRIFFPRAAELTAYHENIYIDTCPGQGTWALKHEDEWLCILNWKNVLFGTDTCFGMPDSIAHFQPRLTVLRDIILDKGHKDKLDAVLHGNAARLLAKHGVTF